MTQLEEAILKTLAYSDIFNYPLRVSEIFRFMIGYKLSHETKLSFLFQQHNLPITQHQGYFSLRRGKEETTLKGTFGSLRGSSQTLKLKVDQRKLHQQQAQKLIEKARNFTRKYLAQIPTLKLLAVTGSVAALNANKHADIDLLAITQENSHWLTRAAILLLLEKKRERVNLGRPPTYNAGRFCLNIVLDESKLKQQENLYVANEIARMKPILNRDNTYERFLEENHWVERYLPNWTPPSQNYLAVHNNPPRGQLPRAFLRPLEKLAYRYQLRNKEKWKQTQTDHTPEVLHKYAEKLRSLNLNP